MSETNPLSDLLQFIKLEAEAAERFCADANAKLDERLRTLRDQRIQENLPALQREELTIYAEYDVRALQNLNRAIAVGTIFSLFERLLWCVARDAQDRGITDPVLAPNKVWDQRGYSSLLGNFGVDLTDLPPELRRLVVIRSELSSFIHAEGEVLKLEDSFVREARELILRKCDSVSDAYRTFLNTHAQAA